MADGDALVNNFDARGLEWLDHRTAVACMSEMRAYADARMAAAHVVMFGWEIAEWF